MTLAGWLLRECPSYTPEFANLCSRFFLGMSVGLLLQAITRLLLTILRVRRGSFPSWSPSDLVQMVHTSRINVEKRHPLRRKLDFQCFLRISCGWNVSPAPPCLPWTMFDLIAYPICKVHSVTPLGDGYSGLRELSRWEWQFLVSRFQSVQTVADFAQLPLSSQTCPPTPRASPRTSYWSLECEWRRMSERLTRIRKSRVLLMV
jgi:hypothetical protein